MAKFFGKNPHKKYVRQFPNSIVKHGILSMKDLHNSGINIYSLDALERASNHLSHINGNDGISLAVVGLTDLYKDEDEYDPYKLECVDFVVDDSVNVESTVVDNQMKKEVWQVAKEVCSDREYKVITLMSKSNMSYEECAKCLNTTVLSVNGCRNKAITKIRRYFA